MHCRILPWDGGVERGTRLALPPRPESAMERSTGELWPSSFRTLLESTGTRLGIARFPARTTIFNQGDRAEDVLLIDAGLVRLAVTTPDGREAVYAVLGPGALLGEEVLGGQLVRRQSAIAILETEAVVIAKDRMIGLLHAQPAISDRLLAHVLVRQARLADDLVDQLLNSSEQRLARALLMLAGCDGRCPSGCEMPQLSQEVIAEMVGTTRSRVNHFISKFKLLGLIEQNSDGLLIKPSLKRVVDR
jgi:CRP-like cAMP-binding protein